MAPVPEISAINNGFCKFKKAKRNSRLTFNVERKKESRAICPATTISLRFNYFVPAGFGAAVVATPSFFLTRGSRSSPSGKTNKASLRNT